MPVREDVNIKVSADVAEAIQGWKEVADGPLALENALKRVGELERQQSQGMGRELDNIVGKWTSVAVGINKAIDALKLYIDTRKQLHQESVEATRDIDTASRQYMISAGVRPGTPQAAAAMEAISAVGVRAQAMPAQAFGAARLLAEFGAPSAEQQGDALRQMLEFQSAADISGRGDPQQMPRAVLEIIRRSKQPMTGQAVRQVGATSMQLMGAGGGFDVGQLEAYAKVAAFAKEAGLDFATGLSFWNALNETGRYTARGARAQFKALLDRRELPGEAEQRAALHRRGAELLGAGGLPYEDIQAIASGSMAQQEQQIEAAYQLSGFVPGVVSGDARRMQMLTDLRRRHGLNIAKEMQAHYFFGAGEYISPEVGARAGTAAAEFDYMRTAVEAAGGPAGYAQAGARAIGVVVRLLGSDGRDIPHEVEAVNIQDR